MAQNTKRSKTFTQDDRRTSIADTLTDANGTVIDLTGHTVAFRMVDAAAGTVKINSAAATVDAALLGNVSYAWGATDLDTPGTYYYWWIVTRTSDSKVEHFPGDKRTRELIVVAKE